MSDRFGASFRRVTIVTLMLSGSLLFPLVAMAQGPGLPAGFGVDGNLLSESPSTLPFGADADWVPGNHPATSAVLDNDGNPINSGTTYHIIDLTRNDDRNVFAGSNKVNDNPNTYEWKAGSVPKKDDIQHVLFHKRIAPNGDVWAIMAGDRRSVDGTSHIDFELLQAGIEKRHDGEFSASGPHNGRTIGDLLITIELTRGGRQAGFYVQRWEADHSARSGYTYHDLTPPPGSAYVTANTDSSVWVPYGAFGYDAYEINAFGEASFNLTEFVSQLDPCIYVPVVFVRTKSSASPNAELKDFVDPIRMHLSIGAHADAGLNKAIGCESGQVQLEGATTTQGATYNWTTENGNIVSGENTLTPTVDAPGRYVLSVTSPDGCTDRDATRVRRQYRAPSDTTIYLCAPADICLGEVCDDDDHEDHDGEHGGEEGHHDSDWHDYDSDDHSSRSGYCVHGDDDESGHDHSSDYDHHDNEGDHDDEDDDGDEHEVFCFTPDTSGVYCFVFEIEHDDGDDDEHDYCDDYDDHDSDEHDSEGEHGGSSSKRPGSRGTMATSGDHGDHHDDDEGEHGEDDDGHYYSYDTVCVTVVLAEPPVITCPPDKRFECASTGDYGRPTVTGNDGIAPILIEDTIPGNCPANYTLRRTWIAINECELADTCVQLIVFDDTVAPVIECAPDLSIGCDDIIPEPVPPQAHDSCDPNPTVRLIGEDIVRGEGCRQSYEIKRFWEAVDACGNADTCVQTIRVSDTEPPVLVCPADTTVDCVDMPRTFGAPAAHDLCDPDPFVSLLWIDTVYTQPGCSGAYELHRFWEARDNCGNADTCMHTVTVIDRTPPACSVPVDTAFVICRPGETICLPVGATDDCDDNTTCRIKSGPGTLSNGQWCYSPTGTEELTIVIECTDDCGNTCEDRFLVSIEFPETPFCEFPADTTIFVCASQEVALPYVTNAGFCEIVSGPGQLVNGRWVYTPTQGETVTVSMRCGLLCGETTLWCEGSFTVIFEFNQPPVCSFNMPSPPLCTPPQVVVPITSADPEGGPTSCVLISGPGQLNGNVWSYTTIPGDTADVTIRCYDDCEAFCEIQFRYITPQPQPPVCVVPTEDQEFFLCAPGKIRVPVQTIGHEGSTITCEVIDGPGAIVGDLWEYAVPASGSFAVTVRCTDGCGVSCEGTFRVVVTVNSPPECVLPTLDTTIFMGAAPFEVCLPVSATDADRNLVSCALVGGPGVLSGGLWCYTPATASDTTVVVRFRCTDACGDYCEGALRVTFDFRERVPPVCGVQAPPEMFLCNAGVEVSIPFAASGVPDDTIVCVVTDGPGALVGGTWRYTPSGDETVNVSIRCANQRDEFCETSFSIQFVINSAPVCVLPNDTVFSGCDIGLVSLPVVMSDADNNAVECAVIGGPGAIVNGRWEYTPAADGKYDITIRCTDECGVYCEGTFSVTFESNRPPECATTDHVFTGCDQVTAVVPLDVTDPDGNLRRCRLISGPGSIQGDNWVFTSVISGTYEIVVRCEDDCGATCTSSFFVTFELNDPPSCNFHDTLIVLCGPSEVRIPLDVTDPNGNLVGCVLVSGPGRIEGNEWIYHVAEDTPVDLTIRCTDECGMLCIRSFQVDFQFRAGTGPMCDFPVGDTVYMCGPGEFCFDIPANCAVQFGHGVKLSAQKTLIGGESATATKGGTTSTSSPIRDAGPKTNPLSSNRLSTGGIDLCFVATEAGTYWAAIECADACGNICYDTVSFEVVFADLPDCGPTLSLNASLSGPCDCPTRGDMNGDGELTAEDMSVIVAMAFERMVLRDTDAACPLGARADVNCDGRIDMNDVEALGEYLFGQGPAPCPRCPSSGRGPGSGAAPRRR